MKEDFEIVADYCESVLPFKDAELPEEYFYESLPLCVIDAIFSLGVRYSNVQKVISNYCVYSNTKKLRTDVDIPPMSSQESISSFCERNIEVGLEQMADKVYINRQRTSAVNGILKAEATFKFAEFLKHYNVEYLQDIPQIINNKNFERDIKSLPGQGSGISLQYFWMLTGSDNLIKPDRMIIRFLSTALNRTVLIEEALPLLSKATKIISQHYNHITPRLLDYVIWNFQRNESDLKKESHDIKDVFTEKQKSKDFSKKRINNGNSIIDKVKSAFISIRINSVFTRSEIVKIVRDFYPKTNPTSIIPSDYCYNMINKDRSSFSTHLFEKQNSGTYKYLGENFPYTGDIEWKKIKVGRWENGNYNLELDPRK